MSGFVKTVRDDRGAAEELQVKVLGWGGWPGAQGGRAGAGVGEGAFGPGARHPHCQRSCPAHAAWGGCCGDTGSFTSLLGTSWGSLCALSLPLGFSRNDSLVKLPACTVRS